ncbi:MAG: hypothetical protein ACE14M_09480 [Terriglobales bacterium]
MGWKATTPCPVRGFGVFALVTALFALGPILASSQAVPESATPPDAREIARRAAEHERINFQRARNYTYIERVETRKRKHGDDVGEPQSQTSEIMILYGEYVGRVIARNDQPLSPKDQAAEEARIQKLIAKRKKETEEEQAKRLADYDRERAKKRAFVDEIADAYDFQLIGDEVVNGRDTYVLKGTPRRGYRPRRKEAKILPKFRFTVWIDKAENQWVKLDAEAIDNISFGWFLGKLYRGSRLRAEQVRVNDEVWLPRHVAISLDGRKLFSKFGMDLDVRYRDYKKFRADTRIVEGRQSGGP